MPSPKKIRESVEDEIDLLDLAQMYLSHIIVILVVTILCGAVGFAYSRFLIAPTYQSTAKLYVVASSSDSVVDLSDLNIGTSLKEDYQDLMMSYPVLDQVSEALKLDYTADELSKMISITNPTDTRVLYITATTESAELSKDIANTLAEVSVKYLPETMNTEAPNIAQEARLEPDKVAPSNAKNAMIGALLGMVLICGFYTVGYLMDDTIQNQEDLEKYFGYVPLTVIPENEALDDKRGSGKGRKGKIFGRKGRKAA